jgi:hypothetical protein
VATWRSLKHRSDPSYLERTRFPESPSGSSDIDDHDKGAFETWVAAALAEL